MIMLAKLCVVIVAARLCLAQTDDSHNWDLAVVINDQIELLQSNGSLIGATVQQFSKLKALTFDNVRHQFVVSDMDQLNDTIFTVQLTKETDITPIVQDLPDDVQGLAIDPITDMLFWTDSINKTINYISLNDSKRQSKILFAFDDQYPQDIAVDVCRRYIYWTNSDVNNPSIERSKLDGTQHEVLVDSDLRRPAGVAIDYRSQRLYWADMREGIYYRIESTNLDGKEREIVYEGTHSKPFGVAVDENAVYWTDVNNNALWKIGKFNHRAHPEKLRDFDERPMGLIAKNLQITKLPDCHNLADAVEKYNESTVEIFIKETDNDLGSLTKTTTPKIIAIQCLNGGESVDDDTCKCPRGFIGKSCEISVCHNFCVHGNCHLSTLGHPQCHCSNGFGGKRCEKEMCSGFCLNNGICHYNSHTSLPTCACQKDFIGRRCEISINIATLCEVFCIQKENDYLVAQNNELICKCDRGSYSVLNVNTTSEKLILKAEQEFLNHIQDPVFMIMLVLIFVLFTLLMVVVCQNRRRPRIKKRIIVNKNVTPLTYRPQPTTEQCEITIENCCNMNVCETPCFEPPQLRGLRNKHDDKKTLLSNMENGDDLY